jgi:hypothetical protein
MNFRLIVIHLIYRVVFGAGIAALMWVAGNFLYAKTYPLYATPVKLHPEMTSGSDMRLLAPVPPRGVDRNSLSIPTRISNGMHSDAAYRDGISRELRNIRAGDEIQVSTPEGTFGYFVTTVEIVPSESRPGKSSRDSELTITATSPFPLAGPSRQRFIVHARLQSELKN